MCPSLEDPDLVFRETVDSQSLTHSSPAECGSRQTIQAWPDHPNRVVSPPIGLSIILQQVAPAPDRPIQQQVTSVCVTSTGPLGLGSGHTQPAMGRSGCIGLPIGSHLGQSGGKAAGPPMQEKHSDCIMVAQHTLVLGPCDHVKPDPSVPAHSANSSLQSDSSQESAKPKSACLAPRASAIKEQGFSEAVAA